MDPVNWLAVALSPVAMLALRMIWPGALFGRTEAGKPNWPRAGKLIGALVLLVFPAAMIGHALARIGVDRLALKPWLYWMQTGGIAAFFIVPALLLGAMHGWTGQGARTSLAEAAYWIAAFLVMGTLFWAMA